MPLGNKKTRASAPKAVNSASDSESAPNSAVTVIHAWMDNCLFFYARYDFEKLSKQFLAYLPVFSKYKGPFRQVFGSLKLTQMAKFLDILIYIYRSEVSGWGKKSVEAFELNFVFNLFLEILLEKCLVFFEEEKKTVKNMLETLIEFFLSNFIMINSSMYHRLLFFFCKLEKTNQSLLYQKILFNSSDVVLRSQISFNGVSKLQELVFKLQEPPVKWFILERGLFWLKKEILLFKTKNLEVIDKLKVLNEFLRTADFSRAASLIPNTGDPAERGSTKRWFHVLQFLLFFIVVQSTYCLSADALTVDSLVTLVPAIKSNGIGLSHTLVFFKKKKTRSCSWLPSRSLLNDGRSAGPPSQKTTGNRKFDLITNGKVVELYQWFLYNTVEDFNSGVVETATNQKEGSSSLGQLVLSWTKRGFTLTPPEAELKLVKESFANRSRVIAFLNSPCSVGVWQKIFDRLKAETKLSSLGLSQLPSETSANPEFRKFCAQFLLTLLPNSEGKFSLCGSIYPYNLGDASKAMYKHFYAVFTFEASKDEIIAKDANKDSANQKEVEGLQTEMKTLEAKIKKNKIALAETRKYKPRLERTKLRKEKDLQKYQEIIYQLLEQQEMTKEKLVNLEGVQNPRREIPAYLTNFLAHTIGEGKNSEHVVLELCHVYPERFTEAFNMDHQTFLTTPLPKELNKPVDEKVFGAAFWFLQGRDPLVVGSKDATLQKVDDVRRYVFLTDWRQLGTKVTAALKYVLAEKLAELASKTKPMFNKVADLSATQMLFIQKSYEDSASIFCDLQMRALPTKYKSFVEKVIDLVYPAGISYQSVLVTPQQRLLHDSAKGVLHKYGKESIVKMISGRLDYLKFRDPEGLLKGYMKINKNDPSDADLDRFYCENEPFISFTAQINRVITPCLSKMVFSYTAAMSLFFLYTLDRAAISNILIGVETKYSDLIATDPDTNCVYLRSQDAVGGSLKETAQLRAYALQQLESFFSIIRSILQEETVLVNSIQGLLKPMAELDLSDGKGYSFLLPEILNLESMRTGYIIFLIKKLKNNFSQICSVENQKKIYTNVLKLVSQLQKKEFVFAKNDSLLSLAQINAALESIECGDYAFEDERLTSRLKGYDVNLKTVVVPAQLDRLEGLFFDFHIFLFGFSQFRAVFSVLDGRRMFDGIEYQRPDSDADDLKVVQQDKINELQIAALFSESDDIAAFADGDANAEAYPLPSGDLSDRPLLDVRILESV